MKNYVQASFILCVLSMATASAQPACSTTPHTTHLLTVNANATCVLAKIYEPQDFCLMNANGAAIDGTPFQVTPGNTAQFEMSFDVNADFNMEYSLTCVKNDGTEVKSPKVIFNIGADGPANPAISVVNLNGAEGTWTATGQGENYSIQF